jgi:5'-methylthioadenosine phosphorylase
VGTRSGWPDPEEALSLRIGVIGGSGLYEMEGLENLREEKVRTPFGDPSDRYVIGSFADAGGDVELVFLPRHGRGHRFNPSEVPYRANVFGMKVLGVSWIISVSAVGSLKKEIAPGDVVLVDQFIDRTRGRPSTFFEQGLVAHVSFGDPVCKTLWSYLRESAHRSGATVHEGGTYVCMEGPAFSTRAESNLYRSWGASVIGMTNLPEAKLAREAEISYATIAMATDYDCWYEGHDEVTVEQVIAVLKANVELSKKIIRGAVPPIAGHAGPAPQASALKNAILTHPSAVPKERLDALAPLVSKYLS